MNDYKELVTDLTEAANRNSNSLNTRDTCRKAADAIEQLVRERDAAVKWIPRQCDTCKHYKHDERETSCMKFGCENWKSKENWEWRGVQK